jgi:hypothetical protein
MKHLAAIILRSLTICLSLITAAAPSAQVCVCCAAEQHRGETRGEDHEKERANEATSPSLRGQRGGDSRLRAGQRLPYSQLDPHGYVQVRPLQRPLADGLRGEQRVRNGCGAVLLC